MRFFSVPAVILGSILLSAIAIPVDHQPKGIQHLPGSGSHDHALTELSALPPSEAPKLHFEPRARVKSKRPSTRKRPSKTRKHKKTKPKHKTTKKTNKKKKPAGTGKKPTKTKSKAPAKATSTPKPEEYWKVPIPSQREVDRNCKVPRNKALFWSGTSGPAQEFARKNGLTTDANAFPGPTKKRPVKYTALFRGKNAKKDAEFANRFSRAFAKKAAGTVHLMVPWAGGPNPTRVFHKVEWPQLKKRLRSGLVTKIIQVNPDNFEDTKEYNPKEYGLTKRSEPVDLKNVKWDVDLDALEEAWKRAEAHQHDE